MNILLVGGSCSLINSMILKLRKEGHRIFLLTGDKYRHNKYERVFEKYEFSYDCENLNDILESVNADVTILMGAFDTNYRWNGEEREIVLFISHLVNILVAYSVKNKKRLIFLSSRRASSLPETSLVEFRSFSFCLSSTLFFSNFSLSPFSFSIALLNSAILS